MNQKEVTEAKAAKAAEVAALVAKVKAEDAAAWARTAARKVRPS